MTIAPKKNNMILLTRGYYIIYDDHVFVSIRMWMSFDPEIIIMKKNDKMIAFVVIIVIALFWSSVNEKKLSLNPIIILNFQEQIVSK